MNNRRIFEINSDFGKINEPIKHIGDVKELDGTTINFICTNNDLDHNGETDAMDLSDCVVRLYAVKRSGEKVYQKDGYEIKLPNRVSFTCADEIFSEMGKVLLELEVIDMDGYIITSPTYSIEVIDKINDENDREIIRIQEVTIMEELKTYIYNSVAEIEQFKEMLNVISGPNYDSLLSQLIAIEKALEVLNPSIQASIKTLEGKLEIVDNRELELIENEDSREKSETGRNEAEALRGEFEKIRIARESERVLNEESRTVSEGVRVESELLRTEQERLRAEDELVRVNSENLRENSEDERIANEDIRKTNDVVRDTVLSDMNTKVSELSEKVDNFSKDGNFDTDLVVKGNVYTTINGKKPVHAGPPTKNAGNILMPYARAIGGFTKDGSAVRTIGFVAKPMDANPNLDITEGQNSDAVFLGTNVSQLYLYSKEKYPTVVSEGEFSPIATQDWVMRLVDGLGLLNGTGDDTIAVASSTPSELFDMMLSEQWSIVTGDWTLSDEEKRAVLSNGQEGLYKPIIAHSSFNEITYVAEDQIGEEQNDVFIGLWKTENYIYGCRIKGKTLNISYFGTNGVRGGASTLTIRDEIKAGDVLTFHYNFNNDIWEMYKFDPNNEPILVYQMSKFMLSGFPEFYNGKNVKTQVSFLVNRRGRVQLQDCPNPDAIRDHTRYSGSYIF